MLSLMACFVQQTKPTWTSLLYSKDAQDDIAFNLSQNEADGSAKIGRELDQRFFAAMHSAPGCLVCILLQFLLNHIYWHYLSLS